LSQLSKFIWFSRQNSISSLDKSISFNISA
jgi:hypothetical protein